MDPLSITASCVGIISGIADVTTSIVTFVGDVREARKDMDGIRRELGSLQLSLSALCDEDKRFGFDNQPALKENLFGVVINCGAIVDEIGKLLDDMDQGSTMKKMKWATTGKRNMAKLKLNLEAHKVALDIALDLIAISITADIKQDTSILKDHTKSIKDDTGQIRDDTNNILKEIVVLQTKVAGLDIQDGRGMIMERFLAEGVAYAESVYAGSVVDFEEIRDDLSEIHEVEEQEVNTKQMKAKSTSNAQDPPESKISNLQGDSNSYGLGGMVSPLDAAKGHESVEISHGSNPDYATLDSGPQPEAFTISRPLNANSPSLNSFPGWMTQPSRGSHHAVITASRKKQAKSVEPGKEPETTTPAPAHPERTASRTPQRTNYWSSLPQEERDKILLDASIKGNLKRIELLLEAGANIDARDSEGNTPLLAVVKHQHRECLAILFQNGAWANDCLPGGKTAYKIAMNQNDVPTAEILLQNGASKSASKPKLRSETQSEARTASSFSASNHLVRLAEHKPAGIALYRFDARESDELSVKQGAVIHDLKLQGQTWCYGRCGLNSGFLPLSYVQTEPNSTATALYSFDAVQANDLTFKKGVTLTNLEFRSEGWWYGKCGSKSGLFPSNYVKLNEKTDIKDPTPKNHNPSTRQSPEPLFKPKKPTPHPKNVRTWHSRDGAFSVEAEFIKMENDKVFLHKTNGVKVAVPAEKFAEEDLLYIND